MALDEIITIDELKSHLGVTGTGRDARLLLLRAGVDAYIRQRTHRDWQELAVTAEAYQGNNSVTLVLQRYPTKAVTAVTVDAIVLDPTDADVLVLDGPKGLLHRTDGAVWPQTHKFDILITYTGGDLPPEDLKLAALEIAAWMSQSSGGRRSVRTGEDSMELFGRALDELPQAQVILDMYTDWGGRYQMSGSRYAQVRLTP